MGYRGVGTCRLRASQEVLLLKLSSTAYIIEVAAVNSAGTGVYSDALSVVTLGELTILYFLLPPALPSALCTIHMTEKERVKEGEREGGKKGEGERKE